MYFYYRCIFNFIITYLFLAAPSLDCLAWLSLVVASRELLFAVVGGLLVAVVSPVEEHRLLARGVSSCDLRALVQAQQLWRVDLAAL